MEIKSTTVRLLAPLISRQIYSMHQRAKEEQLKTFQNLLKNGRNSDYGRKHHFSEIQTFAEFAQAAAAVSYEQLIPYIDRISRGEKDVLWPGKPDYFCKSSGTTAGIKYIPATGVQLRAMIRAARNSLMMYVAETAQAGFFDKGMIFLQGSPELESHGTIASGRLSGIVYHHVPAWLNRNRLPSYATNVIEDWETKVEAIVDESLKRDMGLISGIPPWLIMYFEKLLEKSGKSDIRSLFPNFGLLAYGGVQYAPYRARMEALMGGSVPSVETYPASEGFIAWQDSQEAEGLLLNLDGGIFYEFVRAEEAGMPGAKRIPLCDVQIGVNYALLLSTNAGLWAYEIGDTIRFVSLNPYRILVTGRVKHFLSAFGEHVIAEEVEAAMAEALSTCGGELSEFTVAPLVAPQGEASRHEWLAEFSRMPASPHHFAHALDRGLQKRNIYYRDLREGNLLALPLLQFLDSGSFHRFMKEEGRLGGQNKLPRLTNDRKIAGRLLSFQKNTRPSAEPENPLP